MIRWLCLPLLLLAGGADIERTTVRIVSCHDGDTCRADAEILPGRDRGPYRQCRYSRIEGQCQEEIRQAIMARGYTSQLVVGRTVTLTAIEPDKYDKRVDAFVQLPDGRDLGDALIAAGLARPAVAGELGGVNRLAGSRGNIPQRGTNYAPTVFSLGHPV